MATPSKDPVVSISDATLLELARKLELYVRTRWYHLKGSPECFLGTEAVRWMVVEPICPAKTTEEAVALGAEMVKRGIICHVSLQRPLPFTNAPYFYCFNPAFRVNNKVKYTAANLATLGGRLMALLEVKDRVFLNGDQEVVYPHCFIGREAVKLMVSDSQFPVSNSAEAVELGSCMVSKGLVSYGVSPNGVANLPFKDDEYFYSFSPKLVAPETTDAPSDALPDSRSEANALEIHTEDFKDSANPDAEKGPDDTAVPPVLADTKPAEDKKEAPSEDELDGQPLTPEQLQARVSNLEKQLAHKETLLDNALSQLNTANSQLTECRAQLRLQEELMSRRRQDALFVVSKLQEQNERLMHFAKEVQNLWRDNEELLSQRNNGNPTSNP